MSQTLASTYPASGWQATRRRLVRTLAVLWHILQGFRLALMLGAFRRPYEDRVRRVTRQWLARLLHLLGVEVEIRGRPAPGPVFLVSNHVSWLDIPVLGSQRELYFLSKAEVRDWPLVGQLAAAAGTLFIRRGSGESRQKAIEIAGHMNAGRAVLVFPEGTTTRGYHVRRFFPSLFRAPVCAARPVQPVSIQYLDDSGQVDPSLAFVDDDSFHSHLWAMMARERVRVRVQFHAPIVPDGDDHHDLCRRARASVASGLHRQ
jgi:1-acyl-sn-glycerol-3-phosphate acyltransferase